ncbi:MAG: GNAT family N-acetyltransferase [Ilumatobacteraceae bacterium]
MQLHLAQFNTATLRHPMDHPETASFVALLDEVNRAAEASPGFIWRHGIDSRNTDDPPVYSNPLTLVNASVWESLGALRDYAYKGLHRDVFRRRGDWFVSSEAVMWWVPAGTIPTLDECKGRLDFLLRHGPSPYAFETGQRFPQLAVVARPLDHPDVSPMLAELDRELLAGTPEGGSNFLHIAPEHVEDGNGAFFIAYLDGAPSACGAYRRIDGAPDAAEVKRMWADPAQRGNKLGAAVLATIEAAARAEGFAELRLETGEHLSAAVGLYRRVGFAPCEAWGEYVGVPFSYTMSKQLD